MVKVNGRDRTGVHQVQFSLRCSSLYWKLYQGNSEKMCLWNCVDDLVLVEK